MVMVPPIRGCDSEREKVQLSPFPQATGYLCTGTKALSATDREGSVLGCTGRLCRERLGGSRWAPGSARLCPVEPLEILWQRYAPRQCEGDASRRSTASPK